MTMEAFKTYTILGGAFFAAILLLVARTRKHSSSSAFGVAVIFFGSLVAIPYAVDLLVWLVSPEFKALPPAITGRTKELAIGAVVSLVAALNSLVTTIGTATKTPALP